jgi:hypothetical protein
MLEHHIPEVLATGHFVEQQTLRDEAADTDQRAGYRMVYTARDAASLEAYQRDHAPALQLDHTTRYAGRFQARRELLPILSRQLV